MNTKDVGNISEAKILAALISKGYPLLIPFGDNLRYDFVIERAGAFEKIQCKTGRIRRGCVEFYPCSSSCHRQNGKKKDYHGQVDWFSIYCPDNDKVYLVPIDIIGRAKCNLRVEPTKNNQRSKIHWAHAFEV